MVTSSTRWTGLTALACFLVATVAQVTSCSVLLRTRPLTASKEEVGTLPDDPAPATANEKAQTNARQPDVASSPLARSLQKQPPADKKSGGPSSVISGRLANLNRQTAGVGVVTPGWRIEAEYYSPTYSDEEQSLSVIARRSLSDVPKERAAKTLMVLVEAESFAVRPATPQRLELKEGAAIPFTYKPLKESEGFRQIHVRIQDPALERTLEVVVQSPPVLWGLNEKQWQMLIQVLGAVGGFALVGTILTLVVGKQRTK